LFCSRSPLLLCFPLDFTRNFVEASSLDPARRNNIGVHSFAKILLQTHKLKYDTASRAKNKIADAVSKNLPW
jgi:hypothetical protein